MRSASFAVVALFLAAPGCSREGGSDGAVCHDAADLCGASGDFDEDDCTGDQKSYAECIVDRGDCEPQTLVDCASGAGGGGDAGPDGGGSVQLEVTDFTDSGVGLVEVGFQITNVDESSRSRSLRSTSRSIMTRLACTSPAAHLQRRRALPPAAARAATSSSPSAQPPRSLVYRDGQGPWPTPARGVCSAPGTPRLRGDCCPNDDDDFIDCDDYDCCDAVDRPSSSQWPSRSAAGPENTPTPARTAARTTPTVSRLRGLRLLRRRQRPPAPPWRPLTNHRCSRRRPSPSGRP
jgi:hypothetical protein